MPDPAPRTTPTAVGSGINGDQNQRQIFETGKQESIWNLYGHLQVCFIIPLPLHPVGACIINKDAHSVDVLLQHCHVLESVGSRILQREVDERIEGTRLCAVHHFRPVYTIG